MHSYLSTIRTCSVSRICRSSLHFHVFLFRFFDERIDVFWLFQAMAFSEELFEDLDVIMLQMPNHVARCMEMANDFFTTNLESKLNSLNLTRKARLEKENMFNAHCTYHTFVFFRIVRCTEMFPYGRWLFDILGLYSWTLLECLMLLRMQFFQMSYLSKWKGG